MWFDNAVWYEFYSLGVTGSPEENAWDWSVWNGAAKPVNRIGKIAGWTDHLSRLGVTAVYFSPVFQSDRHGYDTRDYYTIDSRLGSNEDFESLCDTLHKRNIRVVLDGVFNHTGRGFWAFVMYSKTGSRLPTVIGFILTFHVIPTEMTVSGMRAGKDAMI